MNEQDEILNELTKDFSIQLRETVSKEAILIQLEVKISQLLQQNAETFFQLMYRLDIPEGKLIKAIEDKENAVSDLALLIYERQLQKVKSRKARGGSTNDKDHELSW